MSEKKEKDPTVPVAKTDKPLADEQLDQVSGGADFNPQPDPPGDMRRLKLQG